MDGIPRYLSCYYNCIHAVGLGVGESNGYVCLRRGNGNKGNDRGYI